MDAEDRDAIRVQTSLKTIKETAELIAATVNRISNNDPLVHGLNPGWFREIEIDLAAQCRMLHSVE